MPYELSVNGIPHKITKLLGVGKQNAKLKKDQRYLTAFLAMTPYKIKGMGNVCAYATVSCSTNCLHESGMSLGNWAAKALIFRGRLARRLLYFKQPDVFMYMYHREIRLLQKKAEKLGVKLAVRLNLLSDIDWYKKHPEMIINYPDVQFYDYTKDIKKMERFLAGQYAKNYHLTFSRSEINEENCINVLRRRGNVAVVFDTKYSVKGKRPLPKKWRRFKVVDGDESDLRFLDKVSSRAKRGVVIGLRAKGKLRRKENQLDGFVVKTK